MLRWSVHCNNSAWKPTLGFDISLPLSKKKIVEDSHGIDKKSPPIGKNHNTHCDLEPDGSLVGYPLCKLR